MIEGVLFDLFGTLVEYEVGRGGQNFGEFCVTARKLGIDAGDTDILAMSDQSFTTLEQSAAESRIEFSMLDSMETFARTANVDLDPESLVLLVDAYMNCWMQSVRPLAGIDRLVGRVAKSYRVGLISNTHHRSR